MNNMIPITYNNDRPTVSGRALHDALEVQTPYNKWFPRMCEYGFTAGSDFQEVSDKIVQNPQGGRPATDHQLTIDMAKQICMLQRNDKGAEFRQYFIDVENQWNSPEAVVARALQFVNKQLEGMKAQNKQLETRNGELLELNAAQNQQLAEMRPKAGYYDVVLSCKDSVSATVIAKDYGWSAKKLNAFLHEKKVQYKQGRTWVLYQKYAEQGYTATKTPTYLGSDGEQHATIHTYWTQKGRLFIYDLMKKAGHLPLLEQKNNEEEA